MIKPEIQSDLFESSETESKSLDTDLLVGADEIACFFGWFKNGKANARRVYHLADKGTLPIHKVEGLGLVARRSALLNHFANLDEVFWDKTSQKNGNE